LKRQLAWVIAEAFKDSKKRYISVYSSCARWTNKPQEKILHMDCKKVIRVMNWLIDNIFVTFGDKCFRQTIGIPMGTDCAPFLANLFLYSYEYKWIDKQRKLKKFHLLKRFRCCSRYIDDLCLVNNDNLMKKCRSDIYPKELKLVPDESDGLTSPFLDLNMTIRDGCVYTSIYDKRDAFDFPIVNFPTLTGNIPNAGAYGVFIGELVRYARACTLYRDFKSRALLLVKKLKTQFFTEKGLREAFFRFCDNHVLLVQKYGSIVRDLHDEWS
jgi:hypothetical protein